MKTQFSNLAMLNCILLMEVASAGLVEKIFRNWYLDLLV